MPQQRPEKNKSVVLIAQNDALIFSSPTAEAVFKGLAALACTRSSHRFCIPKRLCGETISGQHPKRFRGLLAL
ncbi:MAG: hypothetical protein ACRD6X_22500 [Pyrinomonadaceae bacterium]